MTSSAHIHDRSFCWFDTGTSIKSNRIGGVIVSEFVSSVVDHGLKPQSGQTKDYKINICYFSAKHTALRRESKDGLARNQNNVSEWNDMSTSGMLFQ
jgi:hypothetical protein